MKQAFFVIGPESSGTRMMTKAFISLGIHGDGGHLQEMDKKGFKHAPEKIVFRRSVPHGKVIPAISTIIERMKSRDFEVCPIVILRDKEMCAQSQVKNKHAKNVEKAKKSIKKAINHIYLELSKVNLVPMVVYYEAFVKYKKVRQAFFKDLGLPHPKMKFYNADSKYK